MSVESTLKQCPFCGSSMVQLVHKTGACKSLIDQKFCYVECMDCDGRGPDAWENDHEIWGDSFKSAEEYAIWNWNRRSTHENFSNRPPESTEEGFYWFYGDLFEKTDIHTIQVHEGNYFSRGSNIDINKCIGAWSKMQLPDAPPEKFYQWIVMGEKPK